MIVKALPNLILALMLIASCYFIFDISTKLNFAFFGDEQTVEQISKPQQSGELILNEHTFSLEKSIKGKNCFTNYLDGYSVIIPESFKADMKNCEIVAMLQNETMEIGIYKQPLSKDLTWGSYINYSDAFMNNTADHKKEWKGTTKVGLWDAHMLQWKREPLVNIHNDKNHYASCHIVINNHLVYTLFFKSQEPFVGTQSYMDIVNSFQLKKITAKEITKQEIAVIEETGWQEKTEALFEKYFSKQSQLVWGIYEPIAPNNMKNLENIEASLSYEFPFIISYENFQGEGNYQNIKKELENAKNAGKTLELSLQTTNQNPEEGNMVYDILNGEFDEYIYQLATAIKENEAPVLMRLCNEMNGDWCAYSAYHTSKDTAVFREFYKYVYHKFDEAGAAPYTLWVFNPNEKSMPNFKWNDQSMYYPGSAYVDIIGLTGYNTGTYYEGEEWRSFDEIYAPIYNEMLSCYNKPLMITEFASSSVGGDKEAWIRDMLQAIKKYEEIKVAIWWNGRDMDFRDKEKIGRPYWLNETEGTLRAFKENFKDTLE